MLKHFNHFMLILSAAQNCMPSFGFEFYISAWKCLKYVDLRTAPSFCFSTFHQCLTCLFYLFPASHSLLAKKEEKKDRKKQEIEITLHSKQINNAYTIYCSIPCFTKFLEHPKTIPLPGQLITKAFLQVQLLDACKNIIQTGKWSDWSNLSQQKMTCIRPFLHLLDSIGLAASVFRSCLKSLPVTVMLLVGQFSFTKSHNGHVQ